MEGSTVGLEVGTLDVIEVVMLALLIALPVVWIWALQDAVRRPEGQFRAAGLSKSSWVLRLVLLGSFAAIVYLFMARPKLAKAPAFPSTLRPVPPKPDARMPLRKRDWGDPWGADS